MRAAGLEGDGQQCVPREQLRDLEMGHGLPRRVAVERPAQRIAAVAADRGIDRAAARPRPPDHEREVLPRELPPSDELLQPAVRLGRAGDDEQPGGVAVEAVHDPRPLRLLSPFDVVREQPLHQRSARVPATRMDDEARGLVDHEQVLVLVRHGELHRLRLEARARRRRRLELELLAARELVALRARASVDEDAALAQQPLGHRPRADLRQAGEELVEAPAGGLLRDAQQRHERAAPAAARARRRRAPSAGRRRRSR